MDRIAKERDFYLRLLELGTVNQIEPFLEDALGLIVDMTACGQAVLRVNDPESSDHHAGWSLARGCTREEVVDIESIVSSGIVSEALATGKTVSTASAMLDPRYQGRRSVRAGKIEAVLCVPIGELSSLGVVYLQGRREPGAFTDADRDTVETFARHLAPSVDRLLARLRAEQRHDATSRYREQMRIDGIIGSSPALARVFEAMLPILPLDVSVLFFGESGTGKTRLARAIHNNGPRAAEPFVEVNCAAISQNLAESELFGHEKGAFTGATEQRIGKFEAAGRGTIFLDEVGDMSLESQAKVLRVIQDRVFERVGGNKTIGCEARVIAATNQDLSEAVLAHRFREDLYYRLNVYPIRVPSLAERRADISPLSRYLCRVRCAHHRLPDLQLSVGASAALESADWPGNIRQLEHTIESAVIRATGDGAALVERRHLFPGLGAQGGADTDEATFQEATLRFQREFLARTLEDTGWNIAETARRLDLVRSHVYKLLKRFELARIDE